MVIKWFIKAMNATKFGHSSIACEYLVYLRASGKTGDGNVGDSGAGEDVGFFFLEHSSCQILLSLYKLLSYENRGSKNRNPKAVGYCTREHIAGTT